MDLICYAGKTNKIYGLYNPSPHSIKAMPANAPCIELALTRSQSRSEQMLCRFLIDIIFLFSYIVCIIFIFEILLPDCSII